MKSLSVGVATVALALGLGSVAHAGPWYGKLSVGQTVDADVSGVPLSDDMAYGASLGTGVGPLRVEAGVSRLSGDFAGLVEADALDYRASAFLDFPVGENGSVFVGGGVDYIDAQASVFGSEIDASGAGWHYAGGFAYRLSDRLIGEVQYRHIEADLDADAIGSVDLTANELTVGLRLAL